MFCIESIIYLFKPYYFFTFYNLQNLVSNTFHSLDSRVTVFLVNIMKSNDRNLIFVADLFTEITCHHQVCSTLFTSVVSGGAVGEYQVA